MDRFVVFPLALLLLLLLIVDTGIGIWQLELRLGFALAIPNAIVSLADCDAMSCDVLKVCYKFIWKLHL